MTLRQQIVKLAGKMRPIESAHAEVDYALPAVILWKHGFFIARYGVLISSGPKNLGASNHHASPFCRTTCFHRVGLAMILAGDIGGTKIQLGLFEVSRGALALVREERLLASRYSSLQDAVAAFMAAGSDEMNKMVEAACFACPGPVHAGRIELTNLPWIVDQREVAQLMGFQSLVLINDLEANACGIPILSPEDLFVLHEGVMPAIGHQALVSAGTGLGEALLVWDGVKHKPIPSEGGHCDYAPRTTDEIALLHYLQRSLSGRVSCERVVSGIGMQNIYAFWRDDQRMLEEVWLRERFQEEDTNAVIVECAQNGSSELCVKTVQMFCGTFGAIAGDSALRLLARGGVYLGGGMPPNMLPSLRSSSFLNAFLDKGRMRSLMETIPVKVILQPRCALLGAAAYAQAHLLSAAM